MEQCPIEVWTKIAGFACTDGGYTGCSLSLVSHTMHHIAEPVRYYSISLVGVDQLFAFSDRLAALDHPPTIRHLFIADIHAPRPTIINHDDVREAFSERRQQRRVKAEEDAARIRSTMRVVLSCAAPALYTLCVHNCAFDPTHDITFPHLCDLTIAPITLTKSAANARIRFPSLRRLHIMSAFAPPELWSVVAEAAPDITHLRLSGVNQDTRISHFLHIVLHIHSKHGDSERSAARSADVLGSQEDQQVAAAAAQLHALEAVTVQPAKVTAGWCGTGAHSHCEMIVALGLLQLRTRFSAAEDGQAAETRFCLLPEQQYSYDKAQEDWLDAVEGGHGSWQETAAESEEDTDSENIV